MPPRGEGGDLMYDTGCKHVKVLLSLLLLILLLFGPISRRPDASDGCLSEIIIFSAGLRRRRRPRVNALQNPLAPDGPWGLLRTRTRKFSFRVLMRFDAVIVSSEYNRIFFYFFHYISDSVRKPPQTASPYHRAPI